MKRHNNSYGFHIAKSAVNPNTLYIGTKGSDANLSDAILFLSHADAREYANKHSIELRDAFNVIVPCECSSLMRSLHVIPD